MAREILELAEEQFQKKRDEEGGATPTHLRITPPSRMYCLSHFSYILIIDKGSISLSKNPDHHANTKHIALRYHFIRHHVGKRNVRMEYINTTAMAADILTKALPREQHETTAAMLGMVAV
jgi:hypothetical protein